MNQMPVSVCQLLCSVISRIPQPLQKSILGLVSSGRTLVEVQGQQNVFCMIPLGMTQAADLVHSSAEGLRSLWPEEFDGEGQKSPISQEDILLRQVLSLQRHIRVLFGMPLLWVLPEVWNGWHSLQRLCDSILLFLIGAIRAHIPREGVSNVLCWLIVQVRWTSSQLQEVQSIDICAN